MLMLNHLVKSSESKETNLHCKDTCAPCLVGGGGEKISDYIHSRPRGTPEISLKEINKVRDSWLQRPLLYIVFWHQDTVGLNDNSLLIVDYFLLSFDYNYMFLCSIKETDAQKLRDEYNRLVEGNADYMRLNYINKDLLEVIRMYIEEPQLDS